MPTPVTRPCADVLMSDGRRARIRPPVDGDREELLALHDELDDETLRLRFFTLNRSAGRHYVDHVLGGRPGPLVSLVATVDGRIVGLGTAERITDSAAEVAFVVAGAERGHGLGTLLLEHLATHCRSVGITRLVADVLPANARMAQVFRDAGYSVERHHESGLLRYELSTAVSEEFLTATEARRRVAEGRSAPAATDARPG